MLLQQAEDERFTSRQTTPPHPSNKASIAFQAPSSGSPALDRYVKSEGIKECSTIVAGVHLDGFFSLSLYARMYKSNRLAAAPLFIPLLKVVQLW
jgi:hypothetical protein